MIFKLDINTPCIFCHEEWKFSMHPCYICNNKHVCCIKCAHKYIKNNYQNCFCSAETNIVTFPNNFLLLYSNKINIKKHYIIELHELYLNELSKTKFLLNPLGKQYLKHLYNKEITDYNFLKKGIIKNSKKLFTLLEDM